MSIRNFAKRYAPKALEVSKKTGIMPEVVLAQAILESGAGAHAPGNNLFGIKGPGQVLMTKEAGPGGGLHDEVASFRGYKSPEDSFDDYARFMSGKRYAGVRNGKTLDEQVSALAKSGYATDPNYGKKIGGIASELRYLAGELGLLPKTAQAAEPDGSEVDLSDIVASAKKPTGGAEVDISDLAAKDKPGGEEVDISDLLPSATKPLTEPGQASTNAVTPPGSGNTEPPPSGAISAAPDGGSPPPPQLIGPPPIETAPGGTAPPQGVPPSQISGPLDTWGRSFPAAEWMAPVKSLPEFPGQVASAIGHTLQSLFELPPAVAGEAVARITGDPTAGNQFARDTAGMAENAAVMGLLPQGSSQKAGAAAPAPGKVAKVAEEAPAAKAAPVSEPGGVPAPPPQPNFTIAKDKMGEYGIWDANAGKWARQPWTDDPAIARAAAAGERAKAAGEPVVSVPETPPKEIAELAKPGAELPDFMELVKKIATPGMAVQLAMYKLGLSGIAVPLRLAGPAFRFLLDPRNPAKKKALEQALIEVAPPFLGGMLGEEAK